MTINTVTSAPRSRQITTPAPHHSVFTGRMPFLLPNEQRQSSIGIPQLPQASGNYSCIVVCVSVCWSRLNLISHSNYAVFRIISVRNPDIARFFHKPRDGILFKYHDKSSPLDSTHYAVLYPQNGDRIVAIDRVTSLHPVYLPWCCRSCLWSIGPPSCGCSR